MKSDSYKKWCIYTDLSAIFLTVIIFVDFFLCAAYSIKLNSYQEQKIGYYLEETNVSSIDKNTYIVCIDTSLNNIFIDNYVLYTNSSGNLSIAKVTVVDTNSSRIAIDDNGKTKYLNPTNSFPVYKKTDWLITYFFRAIDSIPILLLFVGGHAFLFITFQTCQLRQDYFGKRYFVE